MREEYASCDWSTEPVTAHERDYPGTRGGIQLEHYNQHGLCPSYFSWVWVVYPTVTLTSYGYPIYYTTPPTALLNFTAHLAGSTSP